MHCKGRKNPPIFHIWAEAGGRVGYFSDFEYFCLFQTKNQIKTSITMAKTGKVIGWVITLLVLAALAGFLYFKFWWVFSDGTKTGELNPSPIPGTSSKPMKER